MLVAILTVGLLAVAMCVAVWLMVRRAGELKSLAERGQPVTGQVIDKRARHSKSNAGRHRRVKIAYERPDTGPQARWIAVTREEWDGYAEGAPVDLMYLPDRPSVFATRALVEQARAALKANAG